MRRTDAIHLNCQFCGREVCVRSTFAGKRIRCPNEDPDKQAQRQKETLAHNEKTLRGAYDRVATSAKEDERGRDLDAHWLNACESVLQSRETSSHRHRLPAVRIPHVAKPQLRQHRRQCLRLIRLAVDQTHFFGCLGEWSEVRPEVVLIRVA